MIVGVRWVYLFLFIPGSVAVGLPPLFRNAVGFDKIMKAGVHRRAYNYIGYGNYCGIGGGGAVVDPIDECCREHDLCYFESQVRHGCNYVKTRYDEGVRLDTGELTCEVNLFTCEREICLCNNELVKCLIDHDVYYNKFNLHLRSMFKSLSRSLKALFKS